MGAQVTRLSTTAALATTGTLFIAPGLPGIDAEPSCDQEYMNLCPSVMPEVGALRDCLAGVDASQVSADCNNWLKLMKDCETDITGDGVCADQTLNDLAVCVTSWKSGSVSEACKAALGSGEEDKAEKKPARKSRAAEKRKRAKRAKEQYAKAKEEEEVKDAKRKGGKGSKRKRKGKKKRKKRKRRSNSKGDL